MLVTMKEVLTPALAAGYAVGAFNIDNIESIDAILSTAVEEHSPVIMAIGQGVIGYTRLETLVAAAHAAAESVPVPVVIHLDHGKSFEQVIRCLRAGFTSVMIDGSHLPLSENIAVVRQAVLAAHAVGVDVEGELGRIGGVEDNHAVDDAEAYMASVADVDVFMTETGVDSLAPAIGNAHGMYRGVPRLDFTRLEAIREHARVPLVLHGGSGIPDDQIRRAISLGVAKINVATEGRLGFLAGLKAAVNSPGGDQDIYKVLRAGRAGAAEVIRTKMRLFGSSGRVEKENRA